MGVPPRALSIPFFLSLLFEGKILNITEHMALWSRVVSSLQPLISLNSYTALLSSGLRFIVSVVYSLYLLFSEPITRAFLIAAYWPDKWQITTPAVPCPTLVCGFFEVVYFPGESNLPVGPSAQHLGSPSIRSYLHPGCPSLVCFQMCRSPALSTPATATLVVSGWRGHPFSAIGVILRWCPSPSCLMCQFFMQGASWTKCRILGDLTSK